MKLEKKLTPYIFESNNKLYYTDTHGVKYNVVDKWTWLYKCRHMGWFKIDLIWREIFDPYIYQASHTKLGILHFTTYSKNLYSKIYNLFNVFNSYQIMEKIIPILSNKLSINFIFLVNINIPKVVRYNTYNPERKTMILNQRKKDKIHLVGLFCKNNILTELTHSQILDYLPELFNKLELFKTNYIQTVPIIQKKPTFSGKNKSEIISEITNLKTNDKKTVEKTKISINNITITW